MPVEALVRGGVIFILIAGMSKSPSNKTKHQITENRQRCSKMVLQCYGSMFIYIQLLNTKNLSKIFVNFFALYYVYGTKY